MVDECEDSEEGLERRILKGRGEGRYSWRGGRDVHVLGKV